MQASPEAAQASAGKPAPRLPPSPEAVFAAQQAAAALGRRHLHEASASKQAEGQGGQGTAVGGVDKTPWPSAQPARILPAGAFHPSASSFHTSWDIHNSTTEPVALSRLEEIRTCSNT